MAFPSCKYHPIITTTCMRGLATPSETSTSCAPITSCTTGTNVAHISSSTVRSSARGSFWRSFSAHRATPDMALQMPRSELRRSDGYSTSPLRAKAVRFCGAGESLVDAGLLTKLINNILLRVGTPEDEASLVADALVCRSPRHAIARRAARADLCREDLRRWIPARPQGPSSSRNGGYCPARRRPKRAY